MPHDTTWQQQELLLAVTVQPNAVKNAISLTSSGIIKIQVKALPADNAANLTLIKFLAKEFGTTQAQITIAHGLHNKKKLLRINNPKKIPSPIKDYLHAKH